MLKRRRRRNRKRRRRLRKRKIGWTIDKSWRRISISRNIGRGRRGSTRRRRRRRRRRSGLFGVLRGNKIDNFFETGAGGDNLGGKGRDRGRGGGVGFVVFEFGA